MNQRVNKVVEQDGEWKESTTKLLFGSQPNVMETVQWVKEWLVVNKRDRGREMHGYGYGHGHGKGTDETKNINSYFPSQQKTMYKDFINKKKAQI